MGQYSKSRFSAGIEKLFSSGSVILFRCKKTQDFPLISVSENAEDILGFAPSYFTKHENGWSNQIHPDDKQEVLSQFRKVINEGGGAINEYRFKTKEGTYIWLRDEIQVIEDEGGRELIYGSSIDITERKKAEIRLQENKTEELKEEIARRTKVEEKLQKRLEYEKVISRCSKLLLESNSSEALEQSLNLLREVTGTDRIFLYKNKEVDDDLYLEPVFEVTKPDIEPVAEKSDRQWKYSDIPWLYEKLSSLQKINGQVDEFPEPERSIFEEQQVQSILIIPFTVEGEWKGHIGFADTQEKRKWSDEEITLLNTIARIIAAYEKRKSIEESLVAQRNYIDTILNSLPSIYLLLDTDMALVEWNDYAEQNTGYSKAEFEDMDAYDLIAAEDHALMEQAVEEARGDMEHGTELRLKTKYGEKKPYYWRGYFIEFSGTEYFLCVGINIMQQKEAEAELLNEKRFNEALLESLPGIFYMFDEEGNYYHWNQHLLDETGYTADEMQEITPGEFFTDDEFESVRDEIGAVFEGGKSSIEANLKTKDGRKIPYYFTGKHFKRDGKDYLIGVGHDISSQVKAREELRKNEELFRNLFLNAPAGIVMVDPENKVLNVNKSFEKTFGFTEEELQGKDIDEFLVPPTERGQVPRMPLKKYASESFHREAKRLTKDGDLVDVFIAAIPVYVDGEPIAGFGMYIDITEEKEYEKQISTSLKEKKILLQEIHHRVKNNLAIVSGLLQLQMYESDDPVIHDTLEESERRIQTMALIHEKLYNSDSLGHISCDSYIGDLVETIRNTIGSDQEVEVCLDIEDIELDINRAVPFALLVNEAVTNSLKHAFEGAEGNQITIHISKENEYIGAQISDNGKGLPDDFSPEESDTLGMNLIDNFARQLDATWSLKSNQGTSLTLEFAATEDG
ncbi:PAS domain S-box protein [Fodinibius sp. Rm-B-1B1-1]|uniref:PAS domain S-box protein n=1 Tax=Fodinibius alkaliphilus TaxID=3140241 RepID=UPI003159B76F